MTVNYLAVLVAAVVGWLAGAVWYTVLAKPWVAAHGKTMEEFKAEQAAHKGTLHAWLPFALAFVAELVMALVLYGIATHIKPMSMRSTVMIAVLLWAGVMVTTMLVNNAFSGRRYMLTVIDSGHWLLVIVLMAVVIGWIVV
jgi:hypothetical protein